MTMFLRRRVAFSAGGPGVGHDYVCELTVSGSIDARTGMVVNIKDVDAVLRAQVVGPLSGEMLGGEAPFRDTPPTPENLARFAWDRCRPALPPEGKLARVTLWAGTTFRAELFEPRPGQKPARQEVPMLTATRVYDFSASHRLHSLSLTAEENAEVFGKCNRENGHGHNYEVEVTLAGDPDPRTGRLFDPDRLDRIVEEEVLTPYDHRHLNLDVPDFQCLNPTSENLTRVIWDNLSRRLPCEIPGGGRLYRVCVRETARNYFEFFGDAPEETDRT